MTQQPLRRLRMGMVGGGRDAFIGSVHRMAAALDGQIDFVAGALSSSPEKAIASGRNLGLADDRNYPSWEAMVESERRLPPDRRIDFVSIVTPNHTHAPIAAAFADAGIHVVCDKPLCTSSEQAKDLIAIAERTGIVFAVTYNYTGYPMVRQARAMVRAGEIGTVRKAVVEYNQGWLATPLEAGGQKQASWRTDPALAGVGGAIGDVGSHAENLLSYITGLELESICADLHSFVAGRRLDDDAAVLLRFTSGARGVLMVSQVESGVENDLRIRIHGEAGSLLWAQQEPNELRHLPLRGPERVLRRGNDGLSALARAACRIPPGHPEGFLGAFANVYGGVVGAIRAHAQGAPPPAASETYPTVYDGARGVWFIEKAVESSRNDRKWTDARWTSKPAS